MKLFSLFEFIQPARSVLARASEFDSISIIPMIIIDAVGFRLVPLDDDGASWLGGI